MDICAIVPSLNPDEKLLDVIKALRSKDFAHIIVVDDGSESQDIFDRIKEYCDIIHHYKNLGKGRAMKTAFNYYLNNYSGECRGVVLLDGDNQHGIADVYNCAQTLLDNPGSLVLGCRDFSLPNVPFTSRNGNKITAFVFKALCGIAVSDTQTGLRALGNSAIEAFLDTKGERFEYETNMLLETKNKEIPIVEVKIETIYLEGNKTSHFNPLTDGLSIYIVLFKYLWASLASMVIDVGTFGISMLIFAFCPSWLAVLISTVTSRILSSLFNFFVNHKLVFKSKERKHSTVWRYYILCVVQLAASYVGVFAVTEYLNMPSLIAKLLVDMLLFVVSFQVQREWVFAKKKAVAK